jgi:hypothetical protein
VKEEGTQNMNIKVKVAVKKELKASSVQVEAVLKREE